MYTTRNFRTKKALKVAVANDERITVYQPGGIFPARASEGDMNNGKVFLEGPHYPAPHTWYAEATLKDGRVVKVK